MNTKPKSRFTPEQTDKMIAGAKALMAQGEKSEKAAIRAGFSSSASYYAAVRKLRPAEKTGTETAEKNQFCERKPDMEPSAEEKVREYERLFASGVPGGRAALLAGFPSWADMAIARKAFNAHGGKT